MLFGVRKESRDRDYPQPREIPSPPFVGRWGVLSYYVPSGLLHPDDVERYVSGPQDGEVLFQCVLETPPYVVVRNNAGREFRVDPGRLIWISEPAFRLGDRVVTKVGTRRGGWIAARLWHFKQQQLYYLIELTATRGRKLHSRRYWDNELELQPRDT
jgi:hypothetical protein